jgi:hypothetical protein
MSKGYRTFFCQDNYTQYFIEAPGEPEAWEAFSQSITPDWEVIPIINEHGGMIEVGPGRKYETISNIPQGDRNIRSHLRYQPPTYVRYQEGGDLHGKNVVTLPEKLDPTLAEPMPTAPPNEEDVGRYVQRVMTEMHLKRVAEDHEARIVWGEKKYGQRLRPHNGRDCLKDLYQEALDGCSYGGQAVLEGRDGGYFLRQFARLADEIRDAIYKYPMKGQHGDNHPCAS